jgi:hypothetical protein
MLPSGSMRLVRMGRLYRAPSAVAVVSIEITPSLTILRSRRAGSSAFAPSFFFESFLAIGRFSSWEPRS